MKKIIYVMFLAFGICLFNNAGATARVVVNEIRQPGNGNVIKTKTIIKKDKVKTIEKVYDSDGKRMWTERNVKYK